MLDSKFENEERKAGVAKLLEKVKASNDEVIDCSGVSMYPSELKLLVEILKSKTFSKLNLAYNVINVDGMRYLQQIILDNKKLVHVALEYNNIDNAAIFELLNNEEIKERLPTIDIRLSCNQLTEEAVEAGLEYYTVMTVSDMISGSHIKNEELIQNINTIVRDYLIKEAHKEEKNEAPSRAPIRFFDLLPNKVKKSNFHLTSGLDQKDPSSDFEFKNSSSRIK